VKRGEPRSEKGLAMSAFDRDNTGRELVRGSSRGRLFLLLTTVLMLAGVLVLACSETAAQSSDTAQKAPSAPAGNAQHGKTVYAREGCYECHGWDAQSGQVKLGPDALPFAAFSHQLRFPRNDMPPYTVKVLSDADVADIYAFVQSVPPPPKLDSIPLLK
jgi:mono/diheme cytochrome c family protein